MPTPPVDGQHTQVSGRGLPGPGNPGRGGETDPLALTKVHRLQGVPEVRPGSGPDLNEIDVGTRTSDEIDLTTGQADPAGDDGVTPTLQEGRSDSLGLDPRSGGEGRSVCWEGGRYQSRG